MLEPRSAVYHVVQYIADVYDVGLTRNCWGAGRDDLGAKVGETIRHHCMMHVAHRLGLGLEGDYLSLRYDTCEAEVSLVCA